MTVTVPLTLAALRELARGLAHLPDVRRRALTIEVELDGRWSAAVRIGIRPPRGAEPEGMDVAGTVAAALERAGRPDLMSEVQRCLEADERDARHFLIADLDRIAAGADADLEEAP